MTSRRQLLSLAATAAVGVLAVGCSAESDALAEQAGSDQGYVSGTGVITQVPAEERGEPLELEFELLDGTTASLAEWRPKAVVINLWYAACPPCRKEAPDLQAVSEEYAPEGVSFVGVNVRDAAGPAQAFEQTYGITYPSLPDTDAQIMYALRGQVAPNAVPSTLVLDREGRVAARISGAADPSVLRAMLDRVLAE